MQAFVFCNSDNYKMLLKMVKTEQIWQGFSKGSLARQWTYQGEIGLAFSNRKFNF